MTIRWNRVIALILVIAGLVIWAKHAEDIKRVTEPLIAPCQTWDDESRLAGLIALALILMAIWAVTKQLSRR